VRRADADRRRWPLRRQLGPLPHTLTVRTGPKEGDARGRHVYGRLPDGVDESELTYAWAGGEVRFAGNGQAAQGMGMIVFPFTFISSAYVPVDSLPGWLQPFAKYQPITEMVDAVRALTLGPQAQALLGHAPSYYVTRALLWTAVILAASAPLAVARYRRG